jgi:hypothetical protein
MRRQYEYIGNTVLGIDVVLLACKCYDIGQIQIAAEFFDSRPLRAFS